MSSLALLQCCCSGPGFVRGFTGGIGQLYHPDNATAESCWCSLNVRHSLARGLTSDGPNGHIIGYDTDRDWLIHTQRAFAGTFGGGVPEGAAVYYQDFRTCAFNTLMPAHVLIDAATALSILESSYPSGLDGYQIHAHWSCLSKVSGEWRLFGWSAWWPVFVPAESHYKVWSVNYEGGDFQTHFAGSPAPAIGSLTVLRGNIETTDGGILIEADFGGVIGIGATGPNANWCFVGDPTHGLYFAFTRDGGNYVFGAGSMGWNEKLGGLEILWVRYNFDPPLPNGFPFAFVTLSTQSISAGNIVGQAGTTIYACQFFGAIFNWNNAGYFWHHPVTIGTMPRPFDLEGWEPPEPPDPRPNCDKYSNLEEFSDSLYLTIEFLEDCTVPDNGGDHPYEEIRTRSNINTINTGTLVLDPASSFTTPGVLLCVNAAKGHFFLPIVDYWSSGTAADRYARLDPKVLFRRDTHFQSWRDDYYVAGYGIELACDDEDPDAPGGTYIKRFEVVTQRFQASWVAEDNDYTDLFPNISMDCHDFETILWKTGVPINANGTTSPGIMQTTFQYDLCGTPKTMVVRATIGAAA